MAGCAGEAESIGLAPGSGGQAGDFATDIWEDCAVSEPICIECGKAGRLVGGRDIYPHRPDLYTKSFYRCECGAYCGCHPGTTKALGHPCGPETRKARSAAHAAFDPLWKQKVMGRADAYAWLAEATGIPAKRCHIGMMTADQARSVVAAVTQRGAS